MATVWIFSALLQDPKYDFRLTLSAIFSKALPCVFALFSVQLFGQLHHCSLGVKNDRSLERVQAVAITGGKLHVIEQRQEQLLNWVRYSCDNLSDIGQSTISFPSAEIVLEHFFMVRDTLTILYSQWNRSLERTEVFAGRYSEKGVLIDSLHQLHFRPENGKPRRSGLQCELSPDSSRFVLFFDSEIERKQTEGIHFRCFNRNLSLLWEKDLRLPPSPEIAQVHHYLLDNRGGIYLMSGRNPIKSFSDWQRPQGGQYVAYYFDPYSKRLKQYDIGLKDKQVLSAEFAINSKQEVVIAGYYSNNFKFKADGTILIILNAHGGSIQKAAYTPFSASFLEAMQDGGKETLEDFYLDHLHVNDSGNVVLIGEQYYVSRFVTTDPTTGRQVVDYRYNFDDVMMHCLDTAAEHIWSLRIAKRQFTNSPSDVHFSYAFAPSAAGYAVIFNDDEASTERLASGDDTQAALWTGSKNSVTTLCLVNPAGQLTRSTLTDNNEERLLFNPLMVIPGPVGQSIFGFSDNRSYKFCRRK